MNNYFNGPYYPAPDDPAAYPPCRRCNGRTSHGMGRKLLYEQDGAPVSLVIEVGKYYRSRDGHKVLIHSMKGIGEFPACGSTMIWGHLVRRCWRLNGEISFYPPHAADLIAEWEEKK